MRQVVFNNCFGGFSLSDTAIDLGMKIAPELVWKTYPDIPRHHPALVQVVKELGRAAGGGYANLQIANVEHKYRIEEYDGNESVMEPSDYQFVD